MRLRKLPIESGARVEEVEYETADPATGKVVQTTSSPETTSPYTSHIGTRWQRDGMRPVRRVWGRLVL